MEGAGMKVREKENKDQPWIETILNERWGGGGQVVIRGEIFDARFLPALVAGEQEGLLTFLIKQFNDVVFAEIITLDALRAGQGVGTALIEALISKLRGEQVSVLQVTTTNDNLNALRFYQRRGFRITGVRPGVVNDARRIKALIPVVGEYGIPIRDEIDLERQVQNFKEGCDFAN
jgi:ribosomal protein S18 acetylase RimI-like enzyme